MPGESEVVLLPVEATRLYLDLRPFMNIAPLAVRYLLDSSDTAVAAAALIAAAPAAAAAAAGTNKKEKPEGKTGEAAAASEATGCG